MTGGINSFKDKIMFEIYKSNDYSNEYRVVYFSELDDHNRDKEIDRAMKQIQNIIDRLNEGESLNSEHLEKQLEEFLAN